MFQTHKKDALFTCLVDDCGKSFVTRLPKADQIKLETTCKLLILWRKGTQMIIYAIVP